MAIRKAFLFSTAITFGLVVDTTISHAVPLVDEQKPDNNKREKKPAVKGTKSGAKPVDGSNASASSSETLIVTGTHAVNRKAQQSTSPVTVLSAATLRRSGQLNLADALTRTYASINVSAMGNDAGALTSAIRMRGLNPNEVLVLVDGKRRHTTANIYADAGPDFGATPVDLNMIPAAAIDHIEVLEDGAAALYGSDAIAGVVNIITKKTNHGLNMSAQTGANAYNGDGWQYQTSIDGGLSLGGDGYLHLSGQVYHTDHMVPYTEDHRLLGYAPAGAATSLYKGSVSVPKNSNKVMSTPEETRENLSIAFGKTLAEGIQGYGLITYAHRHAEAYENYRPPSTLPSVYPSGFSPIETMEENDYAATLGLKGDNFFKFAWDISTTYGADEDKIGDKSSVNAGMLSSKCIARSSNPTSTSAYASTDGCGWSPTSTRAESYRMAQWTNTADFRRNFKTGFATPTTIAFGAEHRLETYEITAGTPPSYEAGGMAGYVGLSPHNAGSWSRDIWAGYLDGDFHPLKHWDVDFAGRFEHYTDVGNTENGKVSTRYDFTRRIAVRGTISNGFRAPTLAEQHFSAINVGASTVSGLLPVSSGAARSLGASPLKPERSTNASAGIVLEPVNGFHVEADVYQINIRDRIIAGGSVNGPTAINAVQQLGFVLPGGLDPNAVSTYYFANGASTRTQGFDLKASYLLHMHRYGNLNLSASLDLNRTRLSHVASTMVNGVSTPLLNAATASYITTAYPRSKLILNAYWTIGKWDVNVRQTRYGQTTDMLAYQDWTPSSAQCISNGQASALRYSNTCFAQFNNTPRWLTDLEIGYSVTPHLHVTVGANNVFNIRPRMVNPLNNNYGARIYDANSAQVPMTGGYYYGRIDARF
ncbi:TonB-dependent siderophore receptor [Komagataeibacter xylinus]|uniref:TonB-dependent receptor n=1 Tax=Komagataeibacter xylinus TaxID=28448 RepID=A0A857FTB2_KOMXY|nr:TonB-dependent receptor [Komagataeibacter xylinus]QHC35704.1 TonB-dependent receptor [Komagataeibacter xylinus]